MSISTLNENMDIVQNLVIPGIDTDMDIIQKLDDEPNDVGGLTAQELKEEFDKAGNIVKTYINGTLLPAISDTVAEEEQRAQAEAQRQANELARQQAEEQRANETSGIVAQATAQAQQAQQSASEAAQSASSAAQNAVQTGTDAASAAQNAAKTASDRQAIQSAIDNIPPGSVPVINNLTTGGAAVALSAEQGKLLGSLSNLTDRQKALANIGGRPRRKLFYNWYFAGGGSQQGGVQFPINQLGQTTYANSGSSDMPCIDGAFISTGTTLEIEESGILISTGSDTKDYYFGKNIKSDGSPYTFSVFAGAFTGSVTPHLTVQQVGGSWTRYASKSISPNAITWLTVSVPKGTEFRVMVFWTTGPNCSAEIIAMGAEHGEGQTLGYQDSSGSWNLFETPDYATTLLECQRHLYVETSTEVYYSYYSGQISGTANQIGFSIPVATNMVAPLNFSSEEMIVLNGDGLAFSTAQSGVFTPTAVIPIGTNVFVYGNVNSISGNLNTSIVISLKNLKITGGD